MMLLDKGFYDYDYEKTGKPVILDGRTKSDEELRGILTGFGIGTEAQLNKPETLEDIQSHIIKQESYGS